MDKGMLADVPMFDELDVGDLPPAAERPGHQADTGAGLTLTFSGINDDYRFFGLIIFKGHYFISLWARRAWSSLTRSKPNIYSLPIFMIGMAFQPVFIAT